MSQLQGYQIKKVGVNKNAPRIWLEGVQPEKGGFLPGTRYNATVNVEKSLLKLEVVENGVRIVSGKQKGDRNIPIIDINSHELLSIFEGIDSVRVIIQEGKIFILPVASDARASQRLKDLKGKLERGEDIAMGALCAGIGVLDHAIHSGLELAGIESKLAFTNEIREDCIDQAAEHNDIVTKDTILLNGPLQEIAFDQYVMDALPKVDILCSGLPCSGASQAGRSKRKLALPEDHPEVGHLIVSFIAIVAKVSPSIVAFENVTNYGNIASMSIMRTSLNDLGYKVFETEVEGEDWNALEHRKRMCMVAVTKGLTGFSFDRLERPIKLTRRLGEIMDDVPLDSPMWSSMSYLKEKQDRDAEAGKGFSMNLVDENSTHVLTLNKTLAKRQSTGTYFLHPEDPNMQRLPTVLEHSRCKGIPEHLIAGANQTFGHECLGQSVIYQPFVAVGKLIGKLLDQFINTTKCGDHQLLAA